MANDRVNQSMGLPNIAKPPEIDFRTGEAEAMRALAKTAHGVSMMVQDRLDDDARIEAAREGAIDGNNRQLNTDTLFAPTIRGQAYTESALKTYQQRLDLDVRQRMAQLEGQHRSDPTAFAQAAQEYKRGLMREVLPDLRPSLSVEFDLRQEVAAARVDKTAMAVAAAEAEANLAALEAAIETDLARDAAGLLSSDPAVSSTAQRSVFYGRERLEAEYGATFEDRFGNTVPLFTEEQRIIAMREYDQLVLMSSMRGWWQETVEETSGIGAAMAIAAMVEGQGPAVMDVDGNPVQIFDSLTEENRKTLLGEMRTQVTFMNSQEDRALRLQEKAVDDWNDDQLMAFTRLGTDRERVEFWSQYMKNPNADPMMAGKMEDLIFERGDQTFPWVMKDVTHGIMTGRITSIDQLPEDGLSASDWKASAQLIAAVADKNHFSNSNDFNAAIDMLRNFHRIPSGVALFGGNDVQAG
jgi:hypothetical protein